MQTTTLRKRKRSGPTLDEGMPRGDTRPIATLDAFDLGSLERLLASKVSIAASTRPRRQGGMVPDEASIVVDDPLELGAKLTATRNIRNDPLGRLHTHHQIDDAQFYAGRAYQRDWEAAERGARAIDPTKEAVDGGKLPEALTDSQAKARMRLIEIEAVLGRKMQTVVRAVLIDGMSTETMALQMFGKHGELARKYYGRMFRDALDELAREYRLA